MPSSTPSAITAALAAGSRTHRSYMPQAMRPLARSRCVRSFYRSSTRTRSSFATPTALTSSSRSARRTRRRAIRPTAARARRLPPAVPRCRCSPPGATRATASSSITRAHSTGRGSASRSPTARRISCPAAPTLLHTLHPTAVWSWPSRARASLESARASTWRLRTRGGGRTRWSRSRSSNSITR